MNIAKRFLAAGIWLLCIATAHIVVAGEIDPATARQVSTTITHIENALQAMHGNEQKILQEQVIAAGQSAKLIIGGSYEARKQRGTRAIAAARRQLAKGDSVAISASLNEALDVFKSLLRPVDAEATRQGGLD